MTAAAAAPPLTVTVTRTVTEQQVLDSLTNWADSGIANFYIKHLNHRPYRVKARDRKAWELWLPVTVTLEEDCEQAGSLVHTLDWEAIRRGLQVMADKFPRAFAVEFPQNPDDYNGDACSADLFLQCCLFGDEVFA